VQPLTEINDIFSAEDWVPTLTAAAGEPDIKQKLLQGYSAGGKSFKVHLDGYDQRDLLAGEGPGKRREFFYWTDDCNLAGLRYKFDGCPRRDQRSHVLALLDLANFAVVIELRAGEPLPAQERVTLGKSRLGCSAQR
jgi:arylsulfatase